MKKPIIILLLCLIGLAGYSQSGLDHDLETYTVCVVDSISPSNQKEIVGVYNYNQKSLAYYHDGTLTVPYTPTGTVIPCYQIVGYSECRLRTVSNSSNKRKWQLAISDVSSYHDDIFLAGIYYEEFLGEGVGPGKKNISIPLNYPYGNTTKEAERFVADIKQWLECKSVHYIDSSTWALPGIYALDFQIHTVRNNFDINLDKAYYSVNQKQPSPMLISKSGGNTVVNSVSTAEVCEVYRKEKNGAVVYVMPYYNTTPLYPNDASYGLLARRIDCNYQSTRGGDCDRPASQNCYLSKTDSTLCTYYLHIPTKDTVTAMWARGTTIPINGSYYATVQPDQKQLQDTLQRWLTGLNYYGRVSVENTKNSTNDGWIFTISYTDAVFDSVQTNRGKYYFEVVDCKDYLFYDVTRNELGGIINTIDQYGRNVMCPPEASVMIPCDQMENIGGCRYQGKWGQELINSTTNKNYDLSKYSSFSIYQTSGNGSFTNNKYPSGTTNIGISQGQMFSVKSEQKCKYLAKQTVNYIWLSGAAIISYSW
jgi:hypothetical protein